MVSGSRRGPFARLLFGATGLFALLLAGAISGGGGCDSSPQAPHIDAGIDLAMNSPDDGGGGLDLGHDGSVAPPSDLASQPNRLRIMSANTTSGNNQSYDPGEGLRIFQGLHPDIALIQEFNYGNNSGAAIRGFVDTAFGPAFAYFRESGAQIPNGIASRHPILASGSWTDPAVANRGFAWARIDIPGPTDLWAVSVHLLTSSAANRDSEAKALVAEIQKNIPAGDLLVIGGDLNTGSRTEACLSSLAAVVSTAAPYPVDNLGDGDTSGARTKPHDWVMPSPKLRSLQTDVVIGAQKFSSGLVVDSRVYTPLADIAPVLKDDSGATSMQHMAVVKDFLLP